MEFLYSLNRLNVATSRARCLAVVVASPALIRVRARTPRQMRLANALCRFIELARSRQTPTLVSGRRDRQNGGAYVIGADWGAWTTPRACVPCTRPRTRA